MCLISCLCSTDQRHLRSSELQMTETELRAMAAEAIQGCRSTPTGDNTPAAMGIPEIEKKKKERKKKRERRKKRKKERNKER